jgi:hypothetical protein
MTISSQSCSVCIRTDRTAALTVEALSRIAMMTGGHVAGLIRKQS